MGKLKKITSSHLFLPLFALMLLLLFNAFATPGFFDIEIQNGQLFGRLIDILNRASILIVLSMGMTFVIATGGIDISQGSVIAISGAVCCSLVGGAGGWHGKGAASAGLSGGGAGVRGLRRLERFSGVQTEYPANGRYADPDDGRPWYRHVDHRRTEYHGVSQAVYLYR